MKDKFPEYFRLSDDEIKTLWDEGIFVFDANILLDLYRYSDETREEFISILEKLKDRVWLPNQSAYEFFNNRLEVISQQEKSYQQMIKDLKNIQKQFENIKHPFLSEELLNRFSDLVKDVIDELNQSIKSHSKTIIQDSLLDRIAELFQGKVGEEFQEKELQELYKVGEERVANKTPPGYKDNTKQGTKKYGDFLVWTQIINKSEKLEQAVIFVTSEKKEDWWLIFNGKTLQPRSELIKEFRDKTENKLKLHMYKPDRFLEFAKKYFKEDKSIAVTERMIKEIRELGSDYGDILEKNETWDLSKILGPKLNPIQLETMNDISKLLATIQRL